MSSHQQAENLDLMGLPLDDAGAPVFAEPWQAQAFAMVLKLHQQGFFTWPEWADTLSAEIKKAQGAGDLDRGDTYYRHWLAALESLVISKNLTDDGELASRRAAWQRAAHATPHGQAIVLAPADQLVDQLVDPLADPLAD